MIARSNKLTGRTAGPYKNTPATTPATTPMDVDAPQCNPRILSCIMGSCPRLYFLTWPRTVQPQDRQRDKCYPLRLVLRYYERARYSKKKKKTRKVPDGLTQESSMVTVIPIYESLESHYRNRELSLCSCYTRDLSVNLLCSVDAVTHSMGSWQILGRV